MATPDATSEAPPLRAAAIALAIIGALAAGALWGLSLFTHERIQRNQQAWIEQPLRALLSSVEYDNDPLSDRIAVLAPDLLGSSTPQNLYRARLRGQPAAAVIHTVAPDGYRGPIDLLVAIAPDQTLIGVQVIRHNETPGLGDAFETRERDWLQAFAGLSLKRPPQQRWTVRRDGGEFDAFTGATITPRAIVKGVRRALEYYRAHGAAAFTRSADE